MSTDPTEFFEEAEKEVAKEAERARAITWKPEVGELLRGRMIRGDLVMANAEPTRLIEVAEVVEDPEDDTKLIESGKVYTVWCSSSYLSRWVVEDAPAEGTLVFIQFHEKVPQEKDPSRSYNKMSARAQESDYEYWRAINQKFAARQEAASNTGMPKKPPITTTHVGPEEAPF